MHHDFGPLCWGGGQNADTAGYEGQIRMLVQVEVLGHGARLKHGDHTRILFPEYRTNSLTERSDV